MKYIKFFIIACCLIAGGSEIVRGQSGNPSTSEKFVMKNGTGNTITLAAPSAGVTNYTLTFPPTVGGTGSTLYSNNATGAMSWLAAGSNGQVLTLAGGIPSWANIPAGTLTSVGLQMPAVLYSSVTNSPITSSGTLIPQLATQTANFVFAGPAIAPAATPTFRALVAGDIPNLSGSYINNSSTLQTANFNISGNGGIGVQLQFQGTSTGITTFQAGAQGVTNINYTLPITAPTAGQILSSTATGALSWATAPSVVFARKTADVILTPSNTTLQPDADLFVPLIANATYEFSGVIAYDGSGGGGTTASDLKIALNYTGTFSSFRWSVDQAGTAITPSSITTNATAASTFHVDATTAANTQSIFVSGIIITTGIGNLQFQEAQATSQAATTTIRANSHLKATRVQ